MKQNTFFGNTKKNCIATFLRSLQFSCSPGAIKLQNRIIAAVFLQHWCNKTAMCAGKLQCIFPLCPRLCFVAIALRLEMRENCDLQKQTHSLRCDLLSVSTGRPNSYYMDVCCKPNWLSRRPALDLNRARAIFKANTYQVQNPRIAKPPCCGR